MRLPDETESGCLPLGKMVSFGPRSPMGELQKMKKIYDPTGFESDFEDFSVSSMRDPLAGSQRTRRASDGLSSVGSARPSSGDPS